MDSAMGGVASGGPGYEQNGSESLSLLCRVSLADLTGPCEILVTPSIDSTNHQAHDTFSSALPSILSLLPLGLRTIDSSVAGLGGCPYSPGATGNVATEDVVRLLHSMGYKTGIDLGMLAETGEWISETLGRRNESNVGRAICARRRKQVKAA